MTTARTFVATIAASALLMLSRAEVSPVNEPEGSPLDASALGAAELLVFACAARPDRDRVRATRFCSLAHRG